MEKKNLAAFVYTFQGVGWWDTNSWRFICWFWLKSRQAETCLSSSEFYSCMVFTSLLREQTHLWMISWVLPPIICAVYLAFCQHVVPEPFLFFLSHRELSVLPAAPLRPPPPATTYAICLCVKSFDIVLMSPQTVVEMWCQTFHHQEGLPACSVELKCVSVHFKWPCWSPRCLVKPVKMACPPSPGSCRCRKSIPRLGCNFLTVSSPGPLAQASSPSRDSSAVPAEFVWPACQWPLATWHPDLSSWPLRTVVWLLCLHTHAIFTCVFMCLSPCPRRHCVRGHTAAPRLGSTEGGNPVSVHRTAHSGGCFTRR